MKTLAIQAAGLQAEDVAAEVAQWMGATPEKDGGVDDALGFIFREAPSVDPGYLIIDGLEEARDRDRLIDLVQILARSGRIRVLVAARPYVVEGAFTSNCLIVDLDANAYSDHEALVEYAIQALKADSEPAELSVFRGEPQTTTLLAAERIAQWSTDEDGRGSFLLAGAAALALRGVPWDSKDNRWAADNPSAEALFARGLESFGSHSSRVKAVLTALAWSEGRGLPRSVVWPAIASAIAAAEGTYSQAIKDEDIQYVLDHAGRYVIEDVDENVGTVYRLFHRLLIDYLQDRPKEVKDTSSAKWSKRQAAIQMTIVDTLKALIDYA